MNIFNSELIKSFLPKRVENSNKGTFGHVLNVAGAKFYTGAAYFSSVSALKAGCGLVTLASEAAALQDAASLCPDIILSPLSKINKDFLKTFNVISIGCGLSQSFKAKRVFKRTLKLSKALKKPLVIDADGLNILAKMRGVALSSDTVLTPHPKEMARLMGANIEEILSEPEIWLKKCCEKYNCAVVLKLHNTLISDANENFYKNETGNSALSHGGSGDVLCGMISGFIAQGVGVFESSVLAVYLHGLAGELASKDLTEYSALASDLVNYIPKAIKTIL